MEGLLERGAVVEDERAHLQDGAHDLAAAGGAEGEALAFRRFAHHGTVVAEAALSGPERVRLPRLRIEPHDAVVEQHAGGRRDNARAEYGEIGLRHRAQISVTVDDAEVSRAAVPVAGIVEPRAPDLVEDSGVVDI